MPLELDDAVEDYVKARDALCKLVSEMFQPGTVVRVARNGNIGIVGAYVNCQPGMVSVLHENMNFWDVAASGLSVVPKRAWHPWVKRFKANSYKATAYQATR